MENLNCLVTTARDPVRGMADVAQQAAKELNLCFVERENRSFDELMTDFAVNTLLMATRQGWVLHTAGGKMFFHLNMAHLRIKNLRAGQSDHMAEAMQIHPGMSVLDCTLGLASDSIVASFVTGEGGKVTGVEVSPLIAFIVKEGLCRFQAEDSEIEAALRRIQVITADYQEYLADQPDNSYDIVYLDPMFRHPIQESVHLKPMRFVAEHRAVTPEILAEAERVARKRVVFKENSRSEEFGRLSFTKIVGGKYSSVHYGVKEINE